MPTFSINIVNSDFASANSVEAASQEAARKGALKGALQMGVDEICQGNPFFGAEIRILNGNEIVERMMVAIGTSPLELEADETKPVEER